jgi:hypothetical protein
VKALRTKPKFSDLEFSYSEIRRSAVISTVGRKLNNILDG